MDIIPKSNRKRGRSPDADCEECMPISKRIHNLNIRSRGCSVDEDTVDGESSMNNNVQFGNNCCCSTNSCRPQPGTSSSTDSSHWLSTPTPAAAQVGPASRVNGHHGGGGHTSQPIYGTGHGPPYQSQAVRVAGSRGRATGVRCPVAVEVPDEDDEEEEDEPMEPYEPELDASENPHYYHTNRLLYDAHVLRTRRHKPNPDPPL